MMYLFTKLLDYWVYELREAYTQVLIDFYCSDACDQYKYTLELQLLFAEYLSFPTATSLENLVRLLEYYRRMFFIGF